MIDEEILEKWFIEGLLQNIKYPLRMHKITTYEEDLKKDQ